MSAVVAAAPPAALRGRLAHLLNATAEGVWRGEDCGNCAGVFAEAAGRCPECAQAISDGEKLGDGITAVQEALTEAGALAAFFDCLASVAGLCVDVEAVAVNCEAGGLPGTTSGGDAGTEHEMTIPGVGK